MLIFDVTKEGTFKSLASWKEQFLIRSNTEVKSFPFVVIGNKIDLEGRRIVDTNTAKLWCEDQGFPYIEASAKTGEGVVKAFEMIAEKYSEEMVEWDPKKMDVGEHNFYEDDEDEDEIVVSNSNKKKKHQQQQQGCCG